MSDTEPTKKKKNPVVYAEQTLGVHQVWDDAQTAQRDMEAITELATQVSIEIRGLRAAIADQENKLATTFRGENLDLSQTAFERQLRTVLHEDDTMHELRDRMIDCQSKQDEAEGRIRLLSATVTITAARLNQLGGLLNFYAAAAVTRTTKQGSA